MTNTINSVADSKLISFLSNTMNVDKNEIKYDSSAKEFVVKGVYRIKRNELETIFSSANEYFKSSK